MALVLGITGHVPPDYPLRVQIGWWLRDMANKIDPPKGNR